MTDSGFGRCLRQGQRHAAAWPILGQGGQAGARHQAPEPGNLRCIDHAGFRQAYAGFPTGINESLPVMPNQQHRIRRHAGLPSIEGLARQNIACGALEVRATDEGGNVSTAALAVRTQGLIGRGSHEERTNPGAAAGGVRWHDNQAFSEGQQDSMGARLEAAAAPVAL